MSMLNVVLVNPEIPHNTGAAGRLCLATGARLHLIKPLGFSIDDRQVKRAGLDYWKHVKITEYENWNDFFENESPETEKLFFFENDGKESFFKPKYPQGCYLIFGAETKGLPEEFYKKYFERFYYLPMFSESRSYCARLGTFF